MIYIHALNRGCGAMGSSACHDELALSYGLAAQELSTLENLAPYALDDPKFSEFVIQVEETISREHTMCGVRGETYR